VVMVGLGRFELPTSRLSGVRSNQLSYRPVVNASVAIDSLLVATMVAAANSFVREPGGSLKTEQDRSDDNRYSDSYRPRETSLRNLVLIRGGKCSLERR
jgi:hypothetical protein